MAGTTAPGNQGSNANWKLELLTLTPQAGRNHDVVLQQQNGGGGVLPMRVKPLSEAHNPASVIATVSVPLKIVADEIVKACGQMSIAIEETSDDPAGMQLCTPQHLRMRLTFRTDGSQIFVLLDREPGQQEEHDQQQQEHDALVSAYSKYFQKAVLSKLKELHSKPIILPKMREVYALMNSQGGFEDAIRVLENFIDTSNAVDGVAVSRVVLSGKSLVEPEGNGICQEISAKLLKASLDPTDLGNRVLSAVVKALKISADPQVLADVRVEDGCVLGEDIIDVFANIVDRHETNPIGAVLAMEGARHLARCSNVAWRSMRNHPQFRKSFLKAHKFGKSRNNHHPLLAEQAKLLYKTLHPEAA